MLMDISPVIPVHAVAATVVIALGPVNLLRRRRDLAHRRIGRVWLVAMAVTCLSAFAIHPHGFNWLHGLAAFTLLTVGLAVVHIRRGNISGHRGNMIGAYVGTLIAFGFAALAPGRLISRVAVDNPAGLLGATALILACCAAVATLALRRPAAGGTGDPSNRSTIVRSG